MRREFAKELHKQMEKNKNIWLVTADLGYGMWDKIREDFPDRFINTGAAEQSCSDICVGLALEGKIPFMYTITPFYYRCFETLRTYINHEKIPVKLIGSGRDKDYAHDGFSHDASDIPLFMTEFENFTHFYPDTIASIEDAFFGIVNDGKPWFISLKR